jgi:hypothetical protein
LIQKSDVDKSVNYAGVSTAAKTLVASLERARNTYRNQIISKEAKDCFLSESNL